MEKSLHVGSGTLTIALMEIPLDKVEAFLRSAPPFDVLPRDARRFVASRVLMEFFPAGEIFIKAGDKPLEFLYLIQKGAARIFDRIGNEETLLDLRAEGDTIGSVSLIKGTPPDFHVAAYEDTICYLVEKDLFLELNQRYPQFRVFSARALKMAQPGEPAARSSAVTGEAVMFTMPVGDLVVREPVFCPPDTTVRQAATIMTNQRVGSMVVVDATNNPIGIFTNQDLRRLVADGGAKIDGPVSAIMNNQPVVIEADRPCFQAILEMGRRNVRHLPVVRDGRLAGVVTQHDLLLLTGANPIAVVKDVETAPSMEQLVQVQYNMDQLAETLVRQGISAPDMGAVASTVNDRLMRRLIFLALEDMDREGLGPPPAPWTWAGLGSAGRREQIMRTDHDCAIVFQNQSVDLDADAQEFFLTLAEKVITGLEECGFPRCRENNMANNPRWCQSLNVWQEYFQAWLRSADSSQLKSAALFFDGRFIFGQPELTRKIGTLVSRELLGNQTFLRNMAQSALDHSTPVGFYRNSVMEKDGRLERRLNLKYSGLQPLVDAVRLLALEQNLPQTNTFERIKALAEAGALDSPLANDAAQAYNYMFMLRVKNYVDGRAIDRFSFDWFSVELMDKLQQHALRQAFKVVDRLQNLIRQRFGL
jgi:CBS domain-containing protein